MHSTVLVNGGQNGEPLASNILDPLGELSNTQPNDTVLLFISGHGIVEEPNYTFVASDAEFSGRRLRNSTVVPWANVSANWPRNLNEDRSRSTFADAMSWFACNESVDE